MLYLGPSARDAQSSTMTHYQGCSSATAAVCLPLEARCLCVHQSSHTRRKRPSRTASSRHGLQSLQDTPHTQQVLMGPSERDTAPMDVTADPVTKQSGAHQLRSTPCTSGCTAASAARDREMQSEVWQRSLFTFTCSERNLPTPSVGAGRGPKGAMLCCSAPQPVSTAAWGSILCHCSSTG